jgi:hypothetical protein
MLETGRLSDYNQEQIARRLSEEGDEASRLSAVELELSTQGIKQPPANLLATVRAIAKVLIANGDFKDVTIPASGILNEGLRVSPEQWLLRKVVKEHVIKVLAGKPLDELNKASISEEVKRRTAALDAFA